MKRKSTLLLTFLLMLYIAPAISAYDNISPDSITSFSETLPDDYMFYPDNETHGSGYAESFVGVDDWTLEVGLGITSDGDLGQFDLPDDNAYDRYWSNNPSFPAGTGTYWEISAHTNDTFQYTYLLAYAYSTDGYGTGSIIPYPIMGYIGNEQTYTFKGYYDGTYAIECVVILAKAITSGHSIEVSVDYLRIGSADEMGWQHDGSTTAGVENGGEAGVTYTTSTDGDALTLNATRTSAGSAWVDIWLVVDTTATAADIERDYYPFLEVKFDAVDSSGCTLYWDSIVEGYKSNENWEPSVGIVRKNIKVMSTALPYKRIVWFLANFADVGDTFEVTLDYAKACSIANFTVTQSGSCTTADVVYVDSNNNLVFDRATTNWIVLETPYTNITTASYPVWNITKSGTLGFGIRMRGGPSYAWGTAVYGTTRGATAGLISVFDPFIIMIQIHSQSVVGVCTISEIKFIEEITMEINIFNELFLSTEIWGYFGPLGLVITGYLLIQKNKALGIFMIIVDSLVISHYLTLVATTPDYWWHIFILLLGVITCVFQMIGKR